MSKGRVVLTALVLVVAVVTTVAMSSCSPADNVPSSANDKVPPSTGGKVERPSPPRVYAFVKTQFGQVLTQTRSELIVMDGTKRIGRAALSALGTDPVFTTDGRYVFSVPLGDEVVAVSIATGKVTKVPCPGCMDRSLECQCQLVVPIGGSEIAWLGSGNHLMRADLAAKKPTPRQIATTVPTWRNDSNETVDPHLLAGTDGAVLAAYPPSQFDPPGPVYLVTPEGTPRRLAPGRQDPIEMAEFSPDGTQVALSGEDVRPVCATVTVVDVKTGKGETRPVKAEPGAKCPTRDGYVGTMWWDRDGVLNAYFQANGRDLMNAGQRRLAKGRWVAADAEQASQVHQLSAGATAIFSHPGIRDKDFLYLEIDGHRTRIGGDVTKVTASPR